MNSISFQVEPILYRDDRSRIDPGNPADWRWRSWLNGEFKVLTLQDLAMLLDNLFNSAGLGVTVAQNFKIDLKMSEY